MEKTASRIASNNQLEVFLKVKQSSNSDFAFLHPADELHRYYLYLKEKHSVKYSSTNKDGDDSDNSPGNPLSNLLGDYASSSDESDVDKKPESKTADNKSSSEDNQQPGKDADEGENTHVDSQSSEQDDKKRKAERLQRLQIWKQYRLKGD
jgi:hypothetical protein